MYSLTTVFYEIFTELEPFAEVPNVFDVVNGVVDSGLRPTVPLDGSVAPEVLELFEQGWQQDASKRPTSSALSARLDALVAEWSDVDATGDEL